MKKGLLIFPYANISDYNTSVNIPTKSSRTELYQKNLCVSAISASKYAGENTDIAVVTNTYLDDEYYNLLKNHNIIIIKCPFDNFNFGKDYKWSLAFYKLCALEHVFNNYEYEYYSYLDTDVFVQNTFNGIWFECNWYVLALCVDERNNNGPSKFQKEVMAFEMQGEKERPVIHYGGEFFAANRINTKIYLQICKEIAEEITRKHFNTNYGDEFISSIAYSKMEPFVKVATAYAYRFWTGVYRLTTQRYHTEPLSILHVPAEKKYGMIRIYDRYFKKNKPVSLSKIHRILHIPYPSFINAIRILIYRVKIMLYPEKKQWK